MSQPSLIAEPVPRGHRLTLFAGGSPLTQGDYLARLADDEHFADWYSAQLCRIAGRAAFWEHPRMSPDTLATPAQCVLLEAPALEAVTDDPVPFAEHFARGEGTVRVFPSLGRDACLVAPIPLAQHVEYAHLMAFLRSASAEQVRALWSTTAQSAQAALRERPVWLSTSGLGVYWLHVRLDQRPKYYQHRAYRDA